MTTDRLQLDTDHVPKEGYIEEESYQCFKESCDTAAPASSSHQLSLNAAFLPNVKLCRGERDGLVPLSHESDVGARTEHHL